MFCLPLWNKRKGEEETNPDDSCFVHHVFQSGSELCLERTKISKEVTLYRK